MQLATQLASLLPARRGATLTLSGRLPSPRERQVSGPERSARLTCEGGGSLGGVSHRDIGIAALVGRKATTGTRASPGHSGRCFAQLRDCA